MASGARGLAALAVTGLAGAMLWTLIPVESAIRRETQAWMDPVRRWTGLDQHWDMFITAPFHHRYAVSVEVEPPGPAGETAKLGPVLPGFQEKPAYFRYHTFFSRLDDPQYAAWLEPYANRLGAALGTAHPEWRSGRFRIRKSAGRIQTLTTIRDLGEIAYEQTTLHGPYPIPDTGAKP